MRKAVVALACLLVLSSLGYRAFAESQKFSVQVVAASPVESSLYGDMISAKMSELGINNVMDSEKPDIVIKATVRQVKTPGMAYFSGGTFGAQGSQSFDSLTLLLQDAHTNKILYAKTIQRMGTWCLTNQMECLVNKHFSKIKKVLVSNNTQSNP